MPCKCGRPSEKDSSGFRDLYEEGYCFECSLQDPETNPYYRPVAPLDERRAKFNATMQQKNKEQQGEAQ